jgi:very-short-patch-repair endonuclease
MSLAEQIPIFSRPDHDESLLQPFIRNLEPDKQELIRFMYSELECMCGSRLEGIMLADICSTIFRLGGNCLEVRRFVKPQHAVGWCRLDFFICPYRFKPNIGFAIECDGEVWHNQTRDHARDRWLRGQGILDIYRFPGAEINKWWTDNAFGAFQKFLRKHHSSIYGTPFV